MFYNLALAGFHRQANLSDSNENPGFNEKSNQSGLTPPAYFAQIVDIHPKGNYS
jgi:hypothetical protein